MMNTLENSNEVKSSFDQECVKRLQQLFLALSNKSYPLAYIKDLRTFLQNIMYMCGNNVELLPSYAVLLTVAD